MEKDIKNNIKEIEPLLKASNKAADNIENLVYGSSDDIRKELSSDSSSITQVLNKLIQDSKETNNGDMIASLERTFKSMSSKEQQAFNKLRDTLENSDNMNIVGMLFDNTASQVNKHEDLEIISNLVPQINDAINTLTDSIISPDDHVKQVSYVLKSNEKVLTTSDPIYTKIRKIIKDNKLETLTKKIVKNALIHKTTHVSVIKYSDAFKGFYEKKIKNNKLNESSNKNVASDYNKKILSEAFNGIKSDFENYDDTINKIENIYNNITINEGGFALIDNIELLYENIDMINPNRKDLEKMVSKDKDNNTSDGFINTKDLNKTWNVPGCSVKILDSRNIVPIKIDEFTLGYFYIENTDTVNMMKNYKNRQSLMGMRSNLTQSKVDSNLDMIYKQLSTMILKKFDKKFIEENKNVSDHIYSLLKYNESLDKNVKITFLQPSEVIEIGIEEGVIDPVLFFAKLYLGLMLTIIMMKISRSNDIRAYYLKSGVTPDVSANVNRAISDLKKDQKTIMHINHIPKLIATYTKFTDLVMPTDKSGNKPIDFDIIGGQDVNIKDDLLEMLEDIMLNGIGVPTPLLSTTNEVDYARRLVMLNAKYLRRIISHQSDLNPGMSLFYREVIKSNMDIDADRTIAETLNYEFSTPITLMLQTMLDQIVNAKDLATNISSILLGDSNKDDLLSDKLMLEIIKKNTPFVPWDEYEKLLEKCKLLIQGEKLDNAEDEI